MAPSLTISPRSVPHTFMNFPLCTELDALEADVAILGFPFGDPYSMEEVTNDQTNAPTAVRRMSHKASRDLDRWDFDLGGTLFDGRDVRVVDCGDVPGDRHDMGEHYRRGEEATRKILEKGALPIVIGGDHGIPIPVLRAYQGHGPVTLVHIDAHIDWRDHINGVREGYSSTIRRASEMAHIDRIVQIGMRAQGSARAEEVEVALAYGADIVPAHEVHSQGMDAVLDRIPENGRYYLTIDADGLDPTEMPAVNSPAPGGILFHQMRTLIHGLVSKGRVVGMDIVEITPSKDVNSITVITAGRIMLNLIGMAARAGYFDRAR